MFISIRLFKKLTLPLHKRCLNLFLINYRRRAFDFSLKSLFWNVHQTIAISFPLATCSVLSRFPWRSKNLCATKRIRVVQVIWSTCFDKIKYQMKTISKLQDTISCSFYDSFLTTLPTALLP